MLCSHLVVAALDDLRIHTVHRIVCRDGIVVYTLVELTHVDGLCGCCHTGVTVFEHTGFCTFDEVAAHLDRTEAENLVEAHGGILQVEWLREIVVCRERDVLRAHILWCQHTLGHQHELDLLGPRVHLQLVTEVTTCKTRHILLADDDVALHFLQVGSRLLRAVVGEEVVDILEA